MDVVGAIRPPLTVLPGAEAAHTPAASFGH